VVGFDMVDDESKPERRPAKHMKTPREWDLKHNPAYAYYAFYTYANLFTLNKLREARGLNTFALRPHAGDFATSNCAIWSNTASTAEHASGSTTGVPGKQAGDRPCRLWSVAVKMRCYVSVDGAPISFVGVSCQDLTVGRCRNLF